MERKNLIDTAVLFHGRELTIVDEPLIMQAESNVGDIEVFNAPAVDEQNRDWIVYWDVLEGDTANWSKPLSAVRIGRFGK